MSNRLRLVRGPAKQISLPGYSSDQVEIGDLLWWDSSNEAARPASQVGGADYAAKKAALAAAFLGVAMSAKDANVSGNVLMATAGDFLFDAPSGTGTGATPINYVAGGDGTNMLDQTVVKTTTAAEAIGRVLAVKSTSQDYVHIRILSKLNLG